MLASLLWGHTYLFPDPSSKVKVSIQHFANVNREGEAGRHTKGTSLPSLAHGEEQAGHTQGVASRASIQCQSFH